MSDRQKWVWILLSLCWRSSQLLHSTERSQLMNLYVQQTPLAICPISLNVLLSDSETGDFGCSDSPASAKQSTCGVDYMLGMFSFTWSPSRLQYELLQELQKCLQHDSNIQHCVWGQWLFIMQHLLKISPFAHSELKLTWVITLCQSHVSLSSKRSWAVGIWASFSISSQWHLIYYIYCILLPPSGNLGNSVEEYMASYCSSKKPFLALLTPKIFFFFYPFKRVI